MNTELAVIATGGKQYLVRPGDVIRIETLDGAAGDAVAFSEVLLHVDGTQVNIGEPLLKDVVVKGSVVQQGRAKKVIGVKGKPKKRQHTKFGHRQHFTEVKITGIGKEE